MACNSNTEEDWIPLRIKKMPKKKKPKKNHKKVPKKDMLLQKDPVRMVWPRPVTVRWKQMPTKRVEDQTDLDELIKVGMKKWLVKRLFTCEAICCPPFHCCSSGKQMPTKRAEDQTDLDDLIKFGLKKWLVMRRIS